MAKMQQLRPSWGSTAATLSSWASRRHLDRNCQLSSSTHIGCRARHKGCRETFASGPKHHSNPTSLAGVIAKGVCVADILAGHC